MKRVTPILCLIVATVLALPASAGDNDLVLNRFGSCIPDEVDPVNKPCVSRSVREDLFNALASDMGLVFSPRFLAPSETLGEAGFEFAAEVSFSVIDNSAEHWTLAMQDRDPPAALTTTQIHIRKGLPFSFELGAIVGYLIDSEMFNLGMELKWTLNEGFYYLPDFSVRGTVNTVVGSSQLNLTTAGFDFSVSKAFGIVGLFNVTPYLGYNLVLVFASSRVLDASPGDPTPPLRDDNEPEFVFGQRNITHHRFFLGCRLVLYRILFAFEMDFAADVQTYSLKLGFDF